MKKRLLAGVLWFYAGWYAWSVIAWFAGLTDLGGPVLGAAVAMFFAGDPLKVIWTRREPVRPAPTRSVASPDPA